MNTSKNNSSPEPNEQEKAPENAKDVSEKSESPESPPQITRPPVKTSVEAPVKAVVLQTPVPEKPLHPPAEAVMTSEHPAERLSDAEAERRIRRMSRRSFVWGAAAVAGTFFGIKWLGSRQPDNGIAWPLRRVLDVNENLSRDLFSAARLAPEFPKSMATEPRPNGDYGVAGDEEPDWKLHLVGLADMSAAVDPASDSSSDSGSDTSDTTSDPADKKAPADKKGSPGKPPPDKKDKKGADAAGSGSADNSADSGKDSASDSSDTSDNSDASDNSEESADSGSSVMEPAVMVTMEAIRALHKTEIVTELKCIEGWSVIVHWAGVRLVDFMKKYPPATKSGAAFNPDHLSDLPNFVSMETPDGAYFVGLDMASALHPQTLLCYEMNGKPLTPEHGAPLRLVIPVKYGIKNIKHIGTIKFTDERPRDYWAKEGYDWYAGH